MVSLSEMKFKDLYIRIDDIFTADRITARYSPQKTNIKQGILANMEVSYRYEDTIKFLIQTIEKDVRHSFSLDWEDSRLRVTKLDIGGGQEKWVCLRKLDRDVPNITELNFPESNVHMFRSWGKRPSGLIVVGGSTGAGKTTTSMSILKEWSKLYGQVSFTIEDPIEYYMLGEINKDNGEPGGNYVFQTEVNENYTWKDGIKSALRWKPRYIFVGEVRTQEAAEGILRAATSGHLAICTVHGGSVEETISGIIQNATNGPFGMNAKNAQNLLADGILGIIHQEMNDESIVTQKVLSATYQKKDDPIREAIRQGEYNKLKSETGKQAERRETLHEMGKTNVSKKQIEEW
jgi:twitching motility protein PilT